MMHICGKHFHRGEMQKNEKLKIAFSNFKKSNVSKVRRVLRTPLVFACQRQVPQVKFLIFFEWCEALSHSSKNQVALQSKIQDSNISRVSRQVFHYVQKYR